MTIPNLLTFARLAATPVVAVLAYSESRSGRAWALGIFIAAMVTDLVDGMIARRPGQSSVLGLYLDPVTDKVLILTMLFVLADLGFIPLWMAALMMARELIVGGLRSAAASRGKVVGANLMGKTKALLQTIAVALGLAVCTLTTGKPIGPLLVTAATGVTLLLAWVFAGVFLWRNRSLLRQAG